MVAKRQATRQPARAAKKVKLDPVSAKVKEVVDTLQRDDCEVGGPSSFKEGLIAAFPLAMGLGSAEDERHSYQQTVGGIVLEILQTSEAKRHESHTAAKEEHAAADAVKSSKEAAVAAAEAALEESTKTEGAARDAHLSSQDALLDAQKKSEEAKAEVENFDTIQLEKAQERAELCSALETEFTALKDGTVEDAKDKKVMLSTVNTVLQKLGVEKALISAATPALTKAPGNRGTFDITVVDQVETAVRSRADSLAEDLNNGETTKASKLAAQAAAQEALAAAEAATTEAQNKVSEAEAQTKQSKIALKQAKESLKEQEKIVKELDIKVFYQDTYLTNFREAIAAFEFLRTRMSTMPEAETEKVLEVEASTTMDEINVVAA